MIKSNPLTICIPVSPNDTRGDSSDRPGEQWTMDRVVQGLSYHFALRTHGYNSTRAIMYARSYLNHDRPRGEECEYAKLQDAIDLLPGLSVLPSREALSDASAWYVGEAGLEPQHPEVAQHTEVAHDTKESHDSEED